MSDYLLSKSHWTKLNKLGLVDGEGNGFANTTKKFDDNIFCNSFRATKLRLEGSIYTFSVQYVSGCFYPIWRIVNEDKFDFLIKKNGEIIRTNQR